MNKLQKTALITGGILTICAIAAVGIFASFVAVLFLPFFLASRNHVSSKAKPDSLKQNTIDAEFQRVETKSNEETTAQE